MEPERRGNLALFEQGIGSLIELKAGEWFCPRPGTGEEASTWLSPKERGRRGVVFLLELEGSLSFPWHRRQSAGVVPY